MLKLSGSTAITRHTRPVIWPCLVPVASQTDHRLNREGHARLAGSDGLVFRIMWNIWCAVERAVDTVTTVSLDDRTTTRLGMLFDDIAEVFERHAGLDDRDCLVKTFSSGLNELDEFLIR